ncbi:MAG: hypothetical protein ACXVBG_25200 [Isosphaeraceae bacterium]
MRCRTRPFENHLLSLVIYAKAVVMSLPTVLPVSRGDTARIDVDSGRSA